MDEARQLDELEEAEIVTPLQSSDAESSSEDEPNPASNELIRVIPPQVIHQFVKLQQIL